MAVGAPTFLVDTQDATAGTSITSDTFSVTSGDYIAYVVVWGNASAVSFSSFGQSFSTSTEHDPVVANNATSVVNMGIAWGACVASATDASATITANFGASVSKSVIVVMRVGANADTTAPTNEDDDVTHTTTTTPSATLPSTPTSGSLLLSAVGFYNPAADGSTTAGSGHTLVNEDVYTGGIANVGVGVQYADGSNGTSLGFTISGGSGSLSQSVVAGFEIPESGGAAAPVVPPETHGKLRKYRQLKAA